MKNVLVLGSSGQIGNYLLKSLGDCGYNALAFDLERSEKEDLRIQNNPELISLLQSADYVFFLAFDVGGSVYLENYQTSRNFLSNNMLIMENTFCLLNKYAVNFLFASSQMSNMGYSNYGLLKLLGERIVDSIPAGKTVHFWNVYGIEHDPDKFHVISDFAAMAKFNKVIKMRTTGTETRDFLHAEDCCNALIAIMENHSQITKEKKLHLSSFKYTSINRVAELIAQHYGANIVPGTKLDMIQLDKQNIPDNFILNYWKPQIDIVSGIQKVLVEFDQIYQSDAQIQSVLSR
jgi:nucleoside-diphosphate-sugar epimerase